MRRFTKDDSELVRGMGQAAIKRPNRVFLAQIAEEFEVETNEGVVHGRAGDYVAYDPISGHVWPVAASYVQQHYDVIME